MLHAIAAEDFYIDYGLGSWKTILGATQCCAQQVRSAIVRLPTWCRQRDADNGYVRRDDTTAATCALLPEHVTGRDVGGERQLGLWSKRRFRCIQGVRHVPRTENALDTCPSSGPFNESVPKKLVMLSKTSPAACAAAMSRDRVSSPVDPPPLFVILLCRIRLTLWISLSP